jgi:hypothetical protein
MPLTELRPLNAPLVGAQPLRAMPSAPRLLDSHVTRPQTGQPGPQTATHRSIGTDIWRETHIPNR